MKGNEMMFEEKSLPRSEMHRDGIVTTGKDGGTLRLISEAGEYLAELFVPPGRHNAHLWVDLVEPGQILEVGPGVVYFPPRGRVTKQTFGDAAFESAANPNFRVSSASRMAKEMERRLSQVELLQRQLAVKKRRDDRVEASAAPEPAKAESEATADAQKPE